ncbi:DDE_3 domain-containing protein [Trichonephila clavipes]|nr:DDE_3 domain-containing protein [Trichonephila clavipes]
MRSIDWNGVELTVVGLWTCGKLFFGVMNLALQSGCRMDASGFGGCPAYVSLMSALCRPLNNAALPTLWQYLGEGPFLFQQDNCSIYSSRLAQKWFDEMGVQKLDWPSQSPDLNTIEQPLG